MGQRRVVVVADDVLWEERRLVATARSLGLDADVMSLAECALMGDDGDAAGDDDRRTVYLIRSAGYHDAVASCTALEARGRWCVNRRSVLDMCGRKHVTDSWLRRHGYAVPASALILRPASAEVVGRALGFPLVVKPPIGGFGNGTHLVRDMDHLASLTEYVFRSGPLYNRTLFAQAFVDVACELRVLVANEAIVGAMERRTGDADGPFIAKNVARGGVGTATELPAPVVELSRSLARLLGAAYVGIDLLVSRDGTVFVCELNAVPRFRELDHVVGGGVARRLVELLATDRMPQCAPA